MHTSASCELRTRSLPGADFLWLLLAHVLQRGFRRSRNYGLLHHRRKAVLRRVQLMLRVVIPPAEPVARGPLPCRQYGSQCVFAWLRGKGHTSKAVKSQALRQATARCRPPANAGGEHARRRAKHHMSRMSLETRAMDENAQHGPRDSRQNQTQDGECNLSAAAAESRRPEP
jgi:hypothetical protein